MSNKCRSGEVEVELTLPFKDTIGVFGFARHNDGSLYIAATIYSGVASYTVARLKADHSLDPDFGIGGFATVSFADYQGMEMVFGSSMVLQDDGGVVLIGNSAAMTAAALARLTSEGKLDPAFGEGGRVVHSWPGAQLPESAGNKAGNWQASSLTGAHGVTRSSGKLLFSYSERSVSGFMAQFLPNGVLHKDFGDHGVVRLRPPGLAEHVTPRCVTELAGGGIAVCGLVFDSGVPRKGFIAKFLPSGVADGTFGDRGYVVVDGPDEFPIESVQMMDVTSVKEGADASLVCSAYLLIQPSGGPRSDYGLVARLTEMGAFLPEFNNRRPVIFGLLGRNNRFKDVTLQADGKVVAVGNSADLGLIPTEADYLVARFNVDGSRDLTFANQGFVTVTPAPGPNEAKFVRVDSGVIAVVGMNYGNPGKIHYLEVRV